MRNLSNTKLFPIDPQNLRHIEILDEFKKENNIYTPIGIFKKEEEKNEFDMELILEEHSKVKDICHIEGYKDIKSCTLSFARKKSKKRKVCPKHTRNARSIHKN